MVIFCESLPAPPVCKHFFRPGLALTTWQKQRHVSKPCGKRPDSRNASWPGTSDKTSPTSAIGNKAANLPRSDVLLPMAKALGVTARSGGLRLSHNHTVRMCCPNAAANKQHNQTTHNKPAPNLFGLCWFHSTAMAHPSNQGKAAKFIPPAMPCKELSLTSLQSH